MTDTPCTWDTIADWYADRLRIGSPTHEFNRDLLLSHLPEELYGHQVLDLGCGEGIVSRGLAARGARVQGIDPSPRMVARARTVAEGPSAGVRYGVDDGRALATVTTGSVDWVTAALSLNNMPDLDAALTATRRVLNPGGRLVFTVPHPCFEAPHATWTDGTRGRRRVVGDYCAEGFWRSGNEQSVRRAGNHHRTLSTYITALIGHGFLIEATAEPAPDERLTDANPGRAGLPPFLLVRARGVS